MTVRWLILTLLFVATTTAAARQEDPKVERGEQIQNASCTTCHDRRPIDIQALDEAGWMKEIAVLNVCTQCHDLQRVRRQRSSAEGWAEILDTMLNEGAPLSAEDFPVVLRYLARNFRPER